LPWQVRHRGIDRKQGQGACRGGQRWSAGGRHVRAGAYPQGLALQHAEVLVEGQQGHLLLQLPALLGRSCVAATPQTTLPLRSSALAVSRCATLTAVMRLQGALLATGRGRGSSYLSVFTTAPEVAVGVQEHAVVVAQRCLHNRCAVDQCLHLQHEAVQRCSKALPTVLQPAAIRNTCLQVAPQQRAR
jgi:hypothetical protein